jgi:hypothetical protein
MAQSSDLTSAEAVELLLLRYELGGMVKQAAGEDFFKSVGDTLQGLPQRAGEAFQSVRNALPSSEQISGATQRVLTPGADDQTGQALQRALMGAGIGAGVGLGSAALGRRKHWLSRALTGAMLGGSAGAALPLVQQGLDTAFGKTPTMKAQDQVKTDQNKFLADRRGVEAPASPDESPPLPQDASGWLNHAIDGAINPDQAARATAIEANRAQPLAATAEAAPLAGRSAVQGLIGYGAGQMASRSVRNRLDIPTAVFNKKIPTGKPARPGAPAEPGLLPGEAPILAQRAYASRPAGVSPQSWKNSLKTMNQNRSRVSKTGLVLGGLAAAEPVVEAATGYTPGSFYRSMFGGEDK